MSERLQVGDALLKSLPRVKATGIRVQLQHLELLSKLSVPVTACKVLNGRKGKERGWWASLAFPLCRGSLMLLSMAQVSLGSVGQVRVKLGSSLHNLQSATCRFRTRLGHI